MLLVGSNLCPYYLASPACPVSAVAAYSDPNFTSCPPTCVRDSGCSPLLYCRIYSAVSLFCGTSTGSDSSSSTYRHSALGYEAAQTSCVGSFSSVAGTVTVVRLNALLAFYGLDANLISTSFAAQRALVNATKLAIGGSPNVSIASIRAVTKSVRLRKLLEYDVPATQVLFDISATAEKLGYPSSAASQAVATLRNNLQTGVSNGSFVSVLKASGVPALSTFAGVSTLSIAIQPSVYLTTIAPSKTPSTAPTCTPSAVPGGDTTKSTNSGGGGDSTTTVMIGAAVGGVGFVLLLSAAFVYWRRRNKDKAESPSPEEASGEHTATQLPELRHLEYYKRHSQQEAKATTAHQQTPERPWGYKVPPVPSRSVPANPEGAVGLKYPGNLHFEHFVAKDEVFEPEDGEELRLRLQRMLEQPYLPASSFDDRPHSSKPPPLPLYILNQSIVADSPSSIGSSPVRITKGGIKSTF